MEQFSLSTKSARKLVTQPPISANSTTDKDTGALGLSNSPHSLGGEHIYSSFLKTSSDVSDF